MDRIKKKKLFAELLLLAFLLLIGWKVWMRSLYYAMYISEILLLTAVLKLIPLLKLSANDLAAAALCMLLNHMILQFPLFGSPNLSDIAPFTFLLLIELLVLIRGIHQRKRGYGIAVGYAVLCCQGVLCIYRQWERIVLDYYQARERQFGFAVKASCLLICIISAALLLLLCLRSCNALIKKTLAKLEEYSAVYTEIDRSILLVYFLTLGTLSMNELVDMLIPFLPADNELHLIPFQPAYSTYEIPLFWIGFSAMMILIQFIYIRLLMKSISVKEKMRLQEKDLHQLEEYNQALEKNMENMKEIRHDMKNMFLTMGGFVSRSNDEEMKAFYQENIVPFARQELLKNDLYAKLSCIHSESLKSFLYYKIMQGIEQHVSIHLQVQSADTNPVYCIGQVDLIRILGILIDNAIEEADTCRGTVHISIKETAGEYLFSVNNTVRCQKKEQGITAGTTDKGPGRGNGLFIVEKLLGEYQNVLLNSYFKNNEFVQCLRIEK